VGEVGVGSVVVGLVVVGDAVVVGPVVVGDVVVGVVGDVVVGGVEVGPVVAGVDEWLRVVLSALRLPPSTRLPSVVPPLEPAPVRSAADLPTTASNPVRTPKPSASVATQLTAAVAQLIGRRSGLAVATLSSRVSGPPSRRVGLGRVARTGIVSLITCWLRSSECE